MMRILSRPLENDSAESRSSGHAAASISHPDGPVSYKSAAVLLFVALVVTGLSVGFMFHEHEALQSARAQVISGELRPLEALLKENQAIIQELKAEPFSEPDSGILESYLMKIRRDGVAKHSDMKQRLDALAENNTAIVTLIEVDSLHAMTSAFVTEGDKFRNYASAWGERWNSVMEVFMAGGNYAASGVPFPNDFAAAVNAEIARRNSRSQATLAAGGNGSG